MPNSSELRKRREQLWEELGGLCENCGQPTILPIEENKLADKEGGQPDNMATIDHKYSVYHPLRITPPDGKRRWYLYCRKCNTEKSEGMEQFYLPLEYRLIGRRYLNKLNSENMTNGIVGKTKQTETQYFEMPLDSYSTLKLFATSRYKFYKKFVEKDPEYQVDEENEAMNLGSLVDVLITGSEKDYHDKFDVISIKRGGGQLWDVADKLWKLTQLCVGEEGEVMREFTDMAQEAFNSVKYDKRGEEVAFKKKEFKDFLEMFQNSDAESLYKERRLKMGKIIVTEYEVAKAEAIAEKLRTTGWTQEILSKISTKNFDVKYQLPVVFTVEGLPIKSKLDIVHIDHINKEIQPYDLKVTHLISNFGYAYWIKAKYYIQEAIYLSAVERYADDKELSDYRIKPMKFIVADPANLSLPIIWNSSYENGDVAFNGAEGKNGYRIRGVKELINELQWAQETNNWTTDKKVVDNNGELSIALFEQVEKTED